MGRGRRTNAKDLGLIVDFVARYAIDIKSYVAPSREPKKVQCKLKY